MINDDNDFEKNDDFLDNILAEFSNELKDDKKDDSTSPEPLKETEDKKPDNFFETKQDLSSFTTKETLSKNKLDAFFETFYGDDNTENYEAAAYNDSAYDDEENNTTVSEPPLPEKFYIKDDFKEEFPIKAPPSTDTKIKEDIKPEETDEYYNTTDEIPVKRGIFSNIIKKLMTEPEDDEEPAETFTPPPLEIDEFESPEDRDSVIADLNHQKKEAFFKTAVGGVVSLLLLYLNIGSVISGLLPSFINPRENIFSFSAASVILLLVMAITGLGTFFSGLKGILTFKGTNDTLPAFALICSAVFLIYCTAGGVPKNSAPFFFFGASALSFFLNLLGKYLHITAVGKNICFLVSEKEKSTLVRMAKSELPPEIDTENNEISGIVKADFFTGFLEKSFGDDPSLKYSRITNPVFILFTVALSVFAYFKGGLFPAFTALSGMSALSASFLSGISYSLPNIRWLSRLNKSGAVITGFKAAADFSKTNAFAVMDTELFPSKSIEVTGMKMFGGSEIYDVAISIASLYNTHGGPLESAFLKIIDYKKELLRNVTDIKIYEGQGISGRLDGKLILAGNAAFMHNMEVKLPYDNYEEKLAKKGKSVIFFAEESVLKGLFTVNYCPESDIIRDLSIIDYENNALLVYTDDHNITVPLIRKFFNLAHMEILVYGCDTGGKMKAALEKKDRFPSGIISTGGMSGIIKAVYAAKKLKKSVKLCLSMRAVSTFLSFGLGGFLIYSSTVMEPLQVLGYQSIWGVLAVILTLLGL